MHFDFLIEDLSGKKTLEILLPKIIDDGHSYRIQSYKGIGHLPTGLKATLDPNTRVLLGQLPRLIQGFGKTYNGYGNNYQAVLIIIVDLDSKNKDDFLQELNGVLRQCTHQPTTHFCLAIEEVEAWFLGDINAINTAYPSAKQTILSHYIPDSICGTWELLANAIYTGGVETLKKRGSHEVGKEKSSWAINITPHMNIDNNKSKSFRYFRNKIQSYL